MAPAVAAARFGPLGDGAAESDHEVRRNFWSASPPPPVRRMLGLVDDVFIAAFAGTGWKRKGLRFGAAALAQGGVPRASLVVAGRGPERAHRGPGVVFLVPQRDVRPLPTAADVFILPTVYDPFSNACLEALAMGRPDRAWP